MQVDTGDVPDLLQKQKASGQKMTRHYLFLMWYFRGVHIVEKQIRIVWS